MYSKKQAQLLAYEMIADLTTDQEGWKTRVWENMGWHFEIKKGCLSVMKTDQKWYYCYLNDSPDYSGGSSYWHTGVRYQNINDAIAAQLAEAKDFVAKCQIIIREIES